MICLTRVLDVCVCVCVCVPCCSVPISSGPVSGSEKQELLADLLSWSASAKAADASLRRGGAASNTGKEKAPRKSLPVRGHADSAFEDAPSSTAAAAAAAANATNNKGAMNLGQELNASALLPAEVTAAAVLEKEKGNECYRAGELDEAVVFYTRALHLNPTDSATLTNRALAFLKLKQPDSALNDAALVLAREPHNWKALWRRGQAQEQKLFLERALDDFGQAQTNWAKTNTPEAKLHPTHPDIAKNIAKVQKLLLEQEPNHPYVQHLKQPKSTAAAAAAKQTTQQQQESKENKEQEPATAPAKAFKRMAIAEVDEDDEDEEEEEKVPEPAAASVASAARPTPVVAPAATATAAAAAAPMRRMPIAEVDDDDDEDAEEVVSTKPVAAATVAAAPAPAPAAVAAASNPSPVVPTTAAAPAAKAAPKKKPSATQQPAFHSKSGGMMIELVSDEEEEEEKQEKAAPAAAAAAAAKTAASASSASASSSSSSSSAAATSAPVAAVAALASSGAFVPPPAPSSSVAFSRDWSGMVSDGRGSKELYAYFRQVSPDALPKLLGGAGVLSAALFATLLSIVAQFYLPLEPSRALDVLKNLEKTDRFALNVGITDQKVKQQIRTALEECAKNVNEQDRAKIAALKKY